MSANKTMERSLIQIDIPELGTNTSIHKIRSIISRLRERLNATIIQSNTDASRRIYEQLYAIDKTYLFPSSYTPETAHAEMHAINFDKYVILTPDQQARLESVYPEYQKLFPFIQSKSLLEWGAEMDTSHYMSTLYDLYFLKKYLVENNKKDALINWGSPVDESFIGSISRVYDAELGNEKNLVAKVYKQNDMHYVTVALTEGLSLKIAGELGAGPKFHGFHITESTIVVLMEKFHAHWIDPEKAGNLNGKDFINGRTLENFAEKMKKLHDAGYTFNGDNGQMLIAEDGEVFFIDIILTKLNDGYMEDFVYGTVKPTESFWYRTNIEELSKYAAENQKI